MGGGWEERPGFIETSGVAFGSWILLRVRRKLWEEQRRDMTGYFIRTILTAVGQAEWSKAGNVQ